MWHVAGAELGDRVERHQEVLLVLELLPDDVLGLALVRRDEARLRLGAEPQRLALGVEHDLDAAPVEVADRLGVEALLDAARQRAGEDDEVGAAREVVELLEQRLELLRRHLRAPLVDLGVRALGRVDDGGRGPRLLADPDEVVQDRLGGQLLDDPRAGPAAGEAGRDDRHVEPLQRAGDVDPLAARERQHLARAVAVPALEVRHGQRAVERGVERDGDDHRGSRTARRGGGACGPRRTLRGRARPARSTAFAATSGERASTCAAVEHLHLAEPLALPDRQLDLHRRDDALDQRPLDVDDPQRGLRGDEADAAARS